MKRTFHKIWLTITVLFSGMAFCSLSMAQEVIWEHTMLNVTNGLTHDAIRSIFQDSEGYMWFGTENGLSRYDGYRFRNYTADFSDKNKLSDGWVNAIVEDNNGILWIGTSAGLHKFDKKTEVFTNYLFNEQDSSGSGQNAIIDLLIGPDNNIWLGSSADGLVKFDRSTEKFTIYPLEKSSDNWVNEIELDDMNNIWASYGEGMLVSFNIPTEKITYYEEGQKGLRKSNFFYTIRFNHHQLYYTFDNGLGVYNSVRDSFEILPNKGGTEIFRNDFINYLLF